MPKFLQLFNFFKILTTTESDFQVIMEHAIGCSLSRHIVLFPQINDEVNLKHSHDSTEWETSDHSILCFAYYIV